MLGNFREVAISVVVAVALFLAIDNMTSRNYVDQISMEPTLHQGQVLLVSRLGISGFTGTVYATTHDSESTITENYLPARGSIVTFQHPYEDRRLVKRLIGLPGDEVRIQEGVVWLNGRQLDEPYVVNHDTRSMQTIIVPADSVFVLGDNRPASADSRYFGPVPRSKLLGQAIVRYWPLDTFSILVGK
jgi:signal peptidase I